MNRQQNSSRPSRESKRIANEQLHALETDVAGYSGSCLFVSDDDGEYCNRLVTSSRHVVSRSSVLDKLVDAKTGKVFELQMGVSQWRRSLFSMATGRSINIQSPSTFKPSEVGTHDACTGKFACASHDNEFCRIDVEEPDFDDAVVRFLAGYRATLFLFDQCHQTLELFQQWNRRAMNNPDRGKRAVWLKFKKTLEGRLQKISATAKLLGEAWYARKKSRVFDSDLVSARVLEFKSKLRLAGCVAYGEYASATVLPTHDGWHRMGLVYLTSDSSEAGKDIERLAVIAKASEEPSNDGVTIAKELLALGWGILAVSPESYRELDDEDRLAIQELIGEHAGSSMWNS